MTTIFSWKLEQPLGYDYGVEFHYRPAYNQGFLNGLTVAETIARQHDTVPRISPEQDSHANANQTGYLTARDQIAETIKECREAHENYLT
jgi:hypothetical protein